MRVSPSRSYRKSTRTATKAKNRGLRCHSAPHCHHRPRYADESENEAPANSTRWSHRASEFFLICARSIHEIRHVCGNSRLQAEGPVSQGSEAGPGLVTG